MGIEVTRDTSLPESEVNAGKLERELSNIQTQESLKKESLKKGILEKLYTLPKDVQKGILEEILSNNSWNETIVRIEKTYKEGGLTPYGALDMIPPGIFMREAGNAMVTEMQKQEAKEPKPSLPKNW